MSRSGEIHLSAVEQSVAGARRDRVTGPESPPRPRALPKRGQIDPCPRARTATPPARSRPPCPRRSRHRRRRRPRSIGGDRCAHFRAPAHGGLGGAVARAAELTSARREITGKVLGARPAMAKLAPRPSSARWPPGHRCDAGPWPGPRPAAHGVHVGGDGAPRRCRRRSGRRGPRGAAADRVARSGADGAERQGGRRRGCRRRLPAEAVPARRRQAWCGLMRPDRVAEQSPQRYRDWAATRSCV